MEENKMEENKMSRIHISASFHEYSSKEEKELLHISLIRDHSIGYDFKSSECKWLIYDDAITVKMNNGKFYFFPLTSVLYYYIESLEEEENGRKEML